MASPSFEAGGGGWKLDVTRHDTPALGYVVKGNVDGS
jgi:hypothetical protein